MNPINKKQIQLIKIGQKKLGLDDSTYRKLLNENFGVSSCTALTSYQAGRLISLFVERGFKITKGRSSKRAHQSISRKDPNVIRLVSTNEKKKIAVLNGLIGWPEEAFHKWMEKRYRILKIRTSRDAFLVIEGLKGVFENRMKKSYGDDWCQRDFDDYSVKEYIRRHC